MSLLCLEALRRHNADAARAVLETASRSSDDVVANRARELIADFSPNVSEWRFGDATASATPRSTTTTTLPRPAIADSQRPHRVRRPGDGGDVVEAKDGPLPHSPGDRRP